MNDVAMGKHRALRPPRGARGVEDHRGVIFTYLDRRCERRVFGELGKTRDPCIIVDGDPMRHIGNVACVGQAVGKRCLVDQQPRAAIRQHIGDLGLLLTGRKQHGHEASMRRAQHRQHELDAVAEQHGDAVAALEAELLKTRRDLRRLPRDFAPGHSPVTANQRFAVRICCNRIGHHRRDAFGPLAECRHDAVAKAGLEPHRRNGVLRPVHQLPLQLFFIW